VNTQGAQRDCRCIPANARGDQRDCTVSGDEPGVQWDQVVLRYVCVYEGCRRPGAWLRALALVSTPVVPLDEWS